MLFLLSLDTGCLIDCLIISFLRKKKEDSLREFIISIYYKKITPWLF